MNTIRFRFFAAVLFLVGLAGTAQAQVALENDPGYVSARTVESWFDAPPQVEINVKGVLLEMVAEAASESNPEFTELLSNLRAVQVRVFDTDVRQRDAVEQQRATLIDDLTSQGWETVVRVREDGEDVNIQLKTRDNAIAGLVVLVTESGGESVFINIVGNISPKELGRLGRALGIDPLEDLEL